MSTAALALVLVAALLHAAWNVLAKKVGGDARFALMTALIVVVLWAPVCLAVGLVDAMTRWGVLEWGVLLASAVIHVAYFIALLRGYRAADLTVVYPVARGTGPLLSSIGAVLWLGESLSLAAAAGVAGVVFGVFCIAGGPALLTRARDPAQRARVVAGLGWGGLTGGLIAAYTLVDGYAVKVLLISPIVVDYVGNVLRVPFLLPTALHDRTAFAALWRLQWRAAFVIALIGPLAYVLVLYAVQLAPLSHVAPAREVSMLFAALLGGRLLGEGDTRMRLIGAACIAGGVAGLALG
ncbi:EamA family transporter [Piscinibacter koreensis]|uniref:EamA family transporter n=1 Tax=Piscinibacter koreensis TaxID=2742824 RepID=A0A7Y6NMA9_9BURK|nr:EamA family transporter [Schlegelella koreensis]